MELPDFKDYSNKELTSTRDRLNAPRGFEVKCPSCGSERLFRDGWRKLADGSKVQRYLCRDCGHRFTDSSHRHGKIHETSDLSKPRDYEKTEDEDLGRAGSRSDMGGGLVLENPLRVEEKPAGDIATSFSIYLLKSGSSKITVWRYVYAIKNLMKNCNIYDPEDVKQFLAKANLSENSKKYYCEVYDRFLKFMKGSWEKPKYDWVKKIPFIPTEEELDQLIAGCGKKIACFLQLLKETGARFGEVAKLKWTDVDFERRVVRIEPEKGSNPRILSISPKLVEMLKNLPRKSERIFSVSMSGLISNFCIQRKHLAKKLGNPRILKISFHTFRHWKATMEYHKTKDILHVKEVLGHKNIQSTMLYISIEKVLFHMRDDEFYCKTASTIDEASKLIECGFEYVTTFNGVMLFRKRK